jgi:hypothetical protein
VAGMDLALAFAIGAVSLEGAITILLVLVLLLVVLKLVGII